MIYLLFTSLIPAAFTCSTLSTYWSDEIRPYASLIERHACYWRLPADFAAAHMWAESRARWWVVGESGEIGLYQIMPADNFTRPELSIAGRPSALELFDPVNNIAFAVHYMAGCRTRTRQSGAENLYDAARCFNRPGLVLVDPQAGQAYSQNIMGMYARALCARGAGCQRSTTPR